MSDQAADKPRGICCPKCGCGHFVLVKITHRKTHIQRRRECRHCGHRVTTSERVVGK